MQIVSLKSIKQSQSKWSEQLSFSDYDQFLNELDWFKILEMFTVFPVTPKLELMENNLWAEKEEKQQLQHVDTAVSYRNLQAGLFRKVGS